VTGVQTCALPISQITLDGTFEVLNGTITEVSGSDVLSSGNVLVRNVTITTPNAGTLNTSQSATATVNGISSTNSATFSYREQRTLTASTAGTVSSIYVPEGGAVAQDGIVLELAGEDLDRKSTRLNSSHVSISYAVFCLKQK